MMKKHPSVFQMSKNLAHSAKEVVTHLVDTGEILVEEEEFSQRLAICTGCEQYDKEANRCYECGCFVSPKAHLASESCPLLKWDGDAIKVIGGVS